MPGLVKNPGWRCPPQGNSHSKPARSNKISRDSPTSSALRRFRVCEIATWHVRAKGPPHTSLGRIAPGTDDDTPNARAESPCHFSTFCAVVDKTLFVHT